MPLDGLHLNFGNKRKRCEEKSVDILRRSKNIDRFLRISTDFSLQLFHRFCIISYDSIRSIIIFYFMFYGGVKRRKEFAGPRYGI